MPPLLHVILDDPNGEKADGLGEGAWVPWEISGPSSAERDSYLISHQAPPALGKAILLPGAQPRQGMPVVM